MENFKNNTIKILKGEVKIDNFVKSKPTLDSWCQHCDGVGFIIDGKSTTKTIHRCEYCEGLGYIKNCCVCGSKSNLVKNHVTKQVMCTSCYHKDIDSKSEIYRKEQFEKYPRIKYKDYNSMFIIDDKLFDKDEFEDMVISLVKEDKRDDIPKHLFATEYVLFGERIILSDVIESMIEDSGYEDMSDFVSTNSTDLLIAQKHLDDWYELEKPSMYAYEEINEVILITDEVIESILKK